MVLVRGQLRQELAGSLQLATEGPPPSRNAQPVMRARWPSKLTIFRPSNVFATSRTFPTPAATAAPLASQAQQPGASPNSVLGKRDNQISDNSWRIGFWRKLQAHLMC